IGGGPAGITLATLVKKYNPKKRILIVEREIFPRHHIGESTLPGMLPILEEMGVLKKIEAAGFMKKVGAVYVRKNQTPWIVPFRNSSWPNLKPLPTYSWQVHRATYDKILLDHARECGVEIWEGHTVLELALPSKNKELVKIHVQNNATTHTQWLETQFLADCSGQGSVLSRYLNIRSPLTQLSNLAIYAYYRCDPFKHTLSGDATQSKIVLRYVEDGWLWYIPLTENLVSVGFVCNRQTLKEKLKGNLRKFYEERLKQSTPIWNVIKNAETVQNVDGTGRELFVIRDYSHFNHRACGKGWIAAGDAAYFVDPIISSGVFMAHMTGMRAAYTLNTFWNSSDSKFRKSMWNDYNLFVQQLSHSFIQMALFWYNREHSALEWCQLAHQLTLTSSETAISQLRSFILLTSGLFPYRTAIGEDSVYWTNARMTLSMLAQQEGKIEKGDLEKMPALPKDQHWKPHLVCDYQVLSSTTMQAGKGMLTPCFKLKFIPQDKNYTSLQPILPVTELHLDVLKQIKQGRSTKQLAESVSKKLKLSAHLSQVFVKEFLKALWSARCIT
ncbi:MAG: tryptophan 7-halogenase, partial [Elusimicrobia bacterium]|nr:tryptophan 7-halogenase [Elusimicrobiota bacterium]